MKNSKNYSKLIYGICIAGTVILTTSVSDSNAFSITTSFGTSQDTFESEISFIVLVNEDDKKFVAEVAEMNIREIALAKLAQEKANSAHVKNLARTMEEDHMNSMAELAELAVAKGISLSTTDPSVPSEAYEKLESLEGDEFGMAYSKLMVEDHTKAIAKFEMVSKNSEDAEIKAWATERLTVLNTHLAEAKACVKACEDTKESPKKDI